MTSSKPQPPLSVIEYPWLHSKSPPRTSTPSLISSLISKYTVSRATKRVTALLPGTSKPLPILISTFLTSAIQTLLKHESSPHIAPALKARFTAGADALTRKGFTPKVSLTSNTYSVGLQSIKVTYGPPSSTPGYTHQKWGQSVWLRVPSAQTQFESTEQQRGILKTAVSQGCSVQVEAVVEGGFEYSVTDQKGEAVLNDTRKIVNVVVESSHSSEWKSDQDVQFVLTDVDGLMKGNQ
ncbi:hypothetical protein BCR33DRAFT_849800 [Rhizoclosmatium globosum]|uniref:Uncharacterized protein n=1 Tax=Rhizoclosmatium globosum TaxID=329046 RepID=A0A1Y2CF36_9FUNG|nr:hypothetical protein BCR33DRAFT_849800 [Rhizoclosmatium globosum]|eukprot:ORY45536.1 hypothetical protein BCR33DRAFT_849800 [Rhizoclosmatium globosum]